MTEREIQIVEASFRLFSQYGVQRIGMSDIAKETGIARQTLYNAFASKDDVLRATIRLFTERAIQSITSEIEAEDCLEKKLDIIFEHIAFSPYKVLNASPHAVDIIEGMNDSSREEIEISHEKFRLILEGVLASHKTHFLASDLKVRDLSDLVQKTVSTAKLQAKDIDHLKQLLDSLKRLLLGHIR